MSDKQKATDKKADVKAQAADAQKTREEVKAAKEAAKPAKEAKTPAPEVPSTKEVSVYKLTDKAAADFEKMKGQRKLMTAAFQKAGKPVAAEQLEPFFENIEALTKQKPLAVIQYHCLKMLEDGYLVETGKITVDVPKRAKKEAPAAAAPAPTPAA